ncbi:MAG: hypothetical protein A2X08_14910 [Bacteroidetes bacterium GWA2_32_17]|nr:MAG: hypothetical protein A2X08_14910 [Bacteroidetes bacterium GWA2_32_17]
MIKAAALFYAVFISIIIALLSGFFILWTFYQNRYLDDEFIKERLVCDVNSSMNIVLEIPETLNQNKINLFDDEVREITFQKNIWGFYQIIVCSGKWNRFNYSKKALIGDDIFSGNKVALYLCDQDDYLNVCGKTLLKGTCWLPKKGIKRAYIEGSSFSGTKFVEGEIKQSEKNLPELNKSMVDYNVAMLEGKPGTHDSLIWFESIQKKDTISNDFNKKTLYVYSEQIIILENKIISGNVIIKSTKGIEIKESAQICDVVIYAPYVIIENNFQGTLQAFVTDSAKIEEDCRLIYPSVIALLNKKDSKTSSFISIGEKTELSGALVLFREKEQQKNSSILKIEKDVIINGQVYCNSLVDHKGCVNGSLYCKRFILSTPSSVYENHLLNATVNFEGLSKYFTGISLLESSNKKEVIRWLQ